mmetsp:Transcript_18271/g.24354  ORF Transcript_18271/g.24354 Transcript_18271/m.24354 type:complete len:105 (+) Transcript_18271:307-621(+)
MNRYQDYLTPVAKRKIRYLPNAKSPGAGVDGRVGKNNLKHVTSPSLSPQVKSSKRRESGRMFWYNLDKAQVEILNSAEESRRHQSLQVQEIPQEYNQEEGGQWI